MSALADVYRGYVDAARAAAETGIALSDGVGDVIFATQNRGVLGFLELSLGDAAAADRQLRSLWPRLAAMGYGEPSVYPVLPNAIHALLEVGDRPQAERLLERLEERGRALDSAWALSQAARLRALVAADEGRIDDALALLDEPCGSTSGCRGHSSAGGRCWRAGRCSAARGVSGKRGTRSAGRSRSSMSWDTALGRTGPSRARPHQRPGARRRRADAERGTRRRSSSGGPNEQGDRRLPTRQRQHGGDTSDADLREARSADADGVRGPDSQLNAQSSGLSAISPWRGGY